MFGRTRNVPERLPDPRPLPANAKKSATGNAGRDGYTCLSRASRVDGIRPPAGGGTRVDWPPRFDNEDYTP
jgi:hypothetical protein